VGIENSLAGTLGRLARARPGKPSCRSVADHSFRFDSEGAAAVIQLGELMMILELHRQGLSITAIARRTGRDPKTVRKLPAYGPRQVGRPNKLAPYLDYLRERIAAFPDLTAVRLTREIKERGYSGAYTAVKRFVSVIRPHDQPKPFEVRFETPPGHQAQVDFAALSQPSPMSLTSAGSFGCSRWCLATPGTSSLASSCIKTCSRCCAVTCWPSAPSAECRSKSFTTA